MPSPKPTVGVNDLQSQCPKTAQEWHPTKNGNLKPTEVTKGSHKKVWWQCSKYPDHEWDAPIYSRADGQGCPICAGSRVLKGFNDLASLEPEIAEEWHPIRNGELKPTEIVRGSHKKVWWQCRNHPDHEWNAAIYSRAENRSCPICSGRVVLEGFNDLQATDPKTAQEWHPTKNGNLKPTEVTKGSHKKVWWQCSKHPLHEWNAPIYRRSAGIGCPVCAGKQVLKSLNDLNTTDPELAKEWHPTKNENLKRTEVTRGSKQTVWWQCSKYPDHEWDASIVDRSSKGYGCPICSGNRVLEGFNDLNTTDPELAKEWHPTKNENLKRTEVTRGSKQTVWWQCSKYPDHEWDASIQRRSKGIGCLICSGRKVLKGFNDLQSLEPQLAKEWHPSRNGILRPSDVTRGSDKKIWWQCRKYPDHEWNASIKSRAQGFGCPVCAGQQVLEGFNDLKTTDPELAKEWHQSKNGDLRPNNFLRFSNKKIWWQCSKFSEHEWEALISSRSSGSGCPICAESGFNPAKDAWFYLMQRPGEQQLGISNVISDRLRTHERNGWTLLERTTEPASGQKVLDAEKALKKWLKEKVGLIEGTTENWSTATLEVQSLAELKTKSGIKTDLF